jgi:hypothetical protein
MKNIEVKTLRASVLLASFAALGIVMFGRDNHLAIALLVLVGLAWLCHPKGLL